MGNQNGWANFKTSRVRLVKGFKFQICYDFRFLNKVFNKTVFQNK